MANSALRSQRTSPSRSSYGRSSGSRQHRPWPKPTREHRRRTPECRMANACCRSLAAGTTACPAWAYEAVGSNHGSRASWPGVGRPLIHEAAAGAAAHSPLLRPRPLRPTRSTQRARLHRSRQGFKPLRRPTGNLVVLHTDRKLNGSLDRPPCGAARAAVGRSLQEILKRCHGCCSIHQHPGPC